MSSFRYQKRLDTRVLPVVVNVMNFAKAPAGEPSLLSFDDARTLFHEFGHGLHGMLSDVTYPLLAGTGVSRDFVEFPSQLFEHWLEEPDLLRRFAVHKDTGEAMPEALLRRLLDARNYNQGFATVEYTASALVDLDLHEMTEAPADVTAFEKQTLARLGMPNSIIMRHRTPHFQHVFSGDGYSASYYAYLWSEVLDADGYDAFHEAGDIFDPATAKRLRDHVYSAGNRAGPESAYRAFRGRDPLPDAQTRAHGGSGLSPPIKLPQNRAHAGTSGVFPREALSVSSAYGQARTKGEGRLGRKVATVSCAETGIYSMFWGESSWIVVPLRKF
jgi:peptidyl-dipeptidase Dcp